MTAGFNNNGIQATADGSTLLVAHTNQGAINAIDPTSGASRTVEGVSVPNVDGILLEGRSLYAVQNFSNQISEVAAQRRPCFRDGQQGGHQQQFEVPTTVARFGDRLATVNAKFEPGSHRRRAVTKSWWSTATRPARLTWANADEGGSPSRIEYGNRPRPRFVVALNARRQPRRLSRTLGSRARRRGGERDPRLAVGESSAATVRRSAPASWHASRGRGI